jgi:serine/threonine protein kinase
VPLAPGTRLGHYDIITLIGEGGMGEVYKARDSRLDRTVALKIIGSGAAAYREHDALANWNNFAMVPAACSRDPRFAAIMARVGLTPGHCFVKRP